MRMKDLVSIIIPVYNANKYIENTVKTVVGQSYENWELLLVDDGSTDGSGDTIKRLAAEDTTERIKVLLPSEHGTAARARNYGIKHARGRYIAFLDADDLWDADKLKKEMLYMKEKNAGFVFTGYEFADANGVGTGKIVKVPETLKYKQALKNTTIFTSTVLLDTQIVDKELIYMPEIKSEDTATWYRILRNGYIAYGLNENLVKYRRVANSLSANKIEAVRRIWNLYRKAEKLSLIYSAYNFVFWAIRAVLRRI
ncbi:MAG: glycosyltransferase family 2 protein [Lachnospiraceae bacterium]|nr:glycosyltransferase family 2 protein [Lachnospiraceae bacterium]